MTDKPNDMTPKERMGEEIATLAARIDAATYELLVLIRKFDEEDGWNNGFLNCAQWLTWRIGLAPGAARERVRVAHALGELPLMSEAMKRGQLSYSKVRALTRVARPETEKELVDLGKAGTAAHIERVVRAWRRIDRSVEANDDELRDAGTVRMTHRNGEILSVGRKTRTIPPPVRRALEFRDRGCRFPGCTSRHCDAHHIRHWADGGETKLSNLVLLCRRHHRLLHEGGFKVRMGADGEVQFFHPRGLPLHESPTPPPVGPYPCDDLLRDLEDAGIVVTGRESMPAWDGTPMDLRYVMESLWKPPPHLQAIVDREQCGSGA